MSTDHIMHPDATPDAAAAGAAHAATWSQLAIENQQGGKGPDVPIASKDQALLPGPTVVTGTDTQMGTGKGPAVPADTNNGTGKGAGAVDQIGTDKGPSPDVPDPYKNQPPDLTPPVQAPTKVPAEHDKGQFKASNVDPSDGNPLGTGNGASALGTGLLAGHKTPNQKGDRGRDEIVMPNGGGDGRHPYDPYIRQQSGSESNPHDSRPGSGQIGEAPVEPSADPRVDNRYTGVNQGKKFDPTPPARPDTGKIGEAPHDPLHPEVIDNTNAGVHTGKNFDATSFSGSKGGAMTNPPELDPDRGSNGGATSNGPELDTSGRSIGDGVYTPPKPLWGQMPDTDPGRPSAPAPIDTSHSAGLPNPEVGRGPGTVDDRFLHIPDLYDPPTGHLKPPAEVPGPKLGSDSPT